jgi:hypothetical protein
MRDYDRRWRVKVGRVVPFYLPEVVKCNCEIKSRRSVELGLFDMLETACVTNSLEESPRLLGGG